MRIECVKCGYPYAEAMYPDTDPPMPCDTRYRMLVERVIEPYLAKLYGGMSDATVHLPE